ncbi:surface antigen [Plasmodium falciparum UGT5.1]|uniref:Surface antigen n=1 Tax=Plasmodium falciparum UGT5.1 TaxID=1237627 RepID=W7JUS7_PLAFA|nr:surface antigen [Plasmodium falciparum UGT5.1]
MKVHYVNILLFALPLNILVGSPKKNPSITQKRPTTRLLCECELYSPANYNNDPQMKSVIDNFNKQTQQRLREYDERLQSKRMQCKEQCDKEIQKIILKDKIEKELAEKFVTLQTDISANDIPTCVCEKSVEDKMEKTCLICGKNLGGAVPGLGVLGAYGVNSMVQAAIDAGIDFATQEGLKEGTQAGIQAIIDGFDRIFNLKCLSGVPLKNLVTANNFQKPMFFALRVQNDYNSAVCTGPGSNENSLLCFIKQNMADAAASKYIATNTQKIVADAGAEAKNVGSAITMKITAEKTAEATSATTILSNPIVISFIVIIIVVIILLIIYLILRYRRKKKMKKKLQYIKLLKE